MEYDPIFIDLTLNWISRERRPTLPYLLYNLSDRRARENIFFNTMCLR